MNNFFRYQHLYSDFHVFNIQHSTLMQNDTIDE